MQQEQSESLRKGEKKRRDPLVDAAHISEKLRNWRRLQQKNLNQLGHPVRNKVALAPQNEWSKTL